MSFLDSKCQHNKHVRTKNIHLCVDLNKQPGAAICGPRRTESLAREVRRMNEGASVRLIGECFGRGVWRGEQREQCVGLASPLRLSFKGPCSTDGCCLDSECAWRAIRRPSPLLPFNSCPLLSNTSTTAFAHFLSFLFGIPLESPRNLSEGKCHLFFFFPLDCKTPVVLLVLK